MAGYTTRFSQAQGLYLSDQLREPTENKDAWRDLLLKVLAAVINDEPAGVEVTLVAEELWTIREVAKSAAQVGKERVGYELLQMCAKGLLGLTGEGAIHEAAMLVGTGDQEEPDRTRYNDKLRRLREGGG